MDYRKFGSKYVVRLEKGEEIVESITRFCRENDIKLGTVSGIGATDKATVGLFETAIKQYHAVDLAGDMEITCLMGNISTMNGDTYLHLHITLATLDRQIVGGHLNSAVISATAEIIIDAIEGQVDRRYSEDIGINLLDF